MATYENYIPRKDSSIMPQLRIRFDVWIALAVFGLLVAGMLVVYSSTYDLAFRSGLSNNDPTFYFRRQFLFLLGGLSAIGVILTFDYHHLRKFSWIIGLATVGMLIAVLFTEGSFGARRGLFNNSIQPSELAKLTMVLYISHWLSSKGDRVRDFWLGLFPFAIMVGGVCGLIMSQPDLSTSAIIFAISVGLFFLSGADWKHFAVAAIVVVMAFVAAISASSYANDRVDAWQEAWSDPTASEQLQIRLIALSLGSGNLLGKGPGHGEVKYFIPAAHTDGTFAVWGEEFGFIGGMMIIGSYVLLAWRGILAARKARDMYGFLLAMGVTLWISIQALLNIAVVTSTIPFTGVPLPFMGYGGTSLMVTLAGVGVLLSVSRDAAIGKTLKRGQTYTRPDGASATAQDEDEAFETLGLRRRNGRARLSGARRRRGLTKPRREA